MRHAESSLSAPGVPLFLQKKMAISQPGDALELEADRVAEAVISNSVTPANLPPGNPGIQRECACGDSSSGECEECQKEREEGVPGTPVIQRLATDAGVGTRDAPPIVHEALRSPGQPLDASVRASMESRFGHDFGDVRVHTDPVAAKSAQAVNSLAYTAGKHVAFAPGQYSPQSSSGKRLLSHELAHVVQQGQCESAVIRRQLAPKLNISMTPQYAAALSDAELTEQISALQYHLSALPQEDIERQEVEFNLQILQSEQRKRIASGGLLQQTIGEAPRPAGLPTDGSYVLYEAPENLQALANLLPEGQLVSLDESPDLSSPQPSRITSPLAGAARGTTATANAMLTIQGFAAAGENSIVVVALPRWGTPGAMVPESINILGHTAVGVRIGGRIQALRGLSPATLELAGNYFAVTSGAAAVSAQITDDVGLLTKTGAVTIEYPVTREVAEAFARQLPSPGPVGAGGPGWTGVPGNFGNPCQGQNCVMWATQQAEQFLKGRIGPEGGPPITDVPRPGQAGQGPLVRFVRSVSEGAEDVAAVEGAIGPAVAGGMSTGLKILKVGGRVMFVVSILTVPLETYLAPPGQRERTFVGATGGLVGGIAGGAFAVALVCGPGALVCGLVIGLGGGLVGSIIGRDAVEEVYDAFEELKDTPRFIKDVTWSGYGTDEARRAWCEQAQIEAELSGRELDPLCDIFR